MHSDKLAGINATSLAIGIDFTLRMPGNSGVKDVHIGLQAETFKEDD